MQIAGVDAIEFSGGTADSDKTLQTIRTSNSDPYYFSLLKDIRKKRCLPVILVGGIHTKGDVNLILKKNIADYVAVSRPLLRDPNIFRKWMNGERDEGICTSCNGCCESLSEMKGPQCVLRNNIK